MTGRPRTLPDDWVLLQMRDAEGYTGKEIASRYGVTPQAVSKRFQKMNRPGQLNLREILPWQVRERDQGLYAAMRLVSQIKERKGEELSDTSLKRLRSWQERLRRDQVVLDYTQVDVGSPWQYVPRIAEDHRLVIRWPAGHEPPTDYQRSMLEMNEQ
jgi:transcriptional regulator with XRE-family HTH domain